MPNSNHPLPGRLGYALAAAGLITALAACGSSGSAGASGASSAATSGGASSSPAATPAGQTSQSAAASQAPVPAESNPPGDIPDTTVYVPYHAAAGHLTVKVPEGWSRKTTASAATFTSNLNSINIAWMPMTKAPTASSVNATVHQLQTSTLAFKLEAVKAASLSGGRAAEIIYQVNSQPNPVTGRQYRLVIERFEFYNHGRAAVLSLSSAVGSDNVDPWRIVSESFRWM